MRALVLLRFCLMTTAVYHISPMLFWNAETSVWCNCWSHAHRPVCAFRPAVPHVHFYTHTHTYTPTVWMEREKRHAHMQTHSVTDTHHTRGAKSTGCSNRRSHPLHSALHCFVFSVVSLCWLLHVRDQVSVLWHDSSACHCDEYLPIFATLGMGRLLSSLASFVFFFSPSSSSSSSSSSLSLSFGTARFSFADAQPTRLLCCRACLWHIQCAGGVREHCARHP